MSFVNPAHLIKEQVKVIYDASAVNEAPAFVANMGLSNSKARYEVHVILNTVNSMLLKAPAVPKDYFILGLLYHEIAHVRYESFKNSTKYESLVPNDIYRWITNIIEDTRIEYHLSYDYPYVAKFIALMLLVTKDKILSDPLEANTDIEKKSQWMLKMVKLNKIPDDCDDEEFAEFMLPRILLARRSNRKKAEAIIHEIYQYFTLGGSGELPQGVSYEEYSAIGDNGENGENDSETEENDSEIQGKGSDSGEGKEGEGAGEQGDAASKLVDDKISELLKELQKAGGGGSGADGSVADIIDDVVNANDFVRATIRAEADNVKKVNKAFSEIFTKMGNVKVKEGDLNVLRVQEAYLNQQVHEEGYDYHRPAKVNTGFDCAILRDISGSTHHCENDYAKATVIIAKALEELKDVRTQIIDFEGDSYVVKTMDRTLSKASIRPLSLGGTNLGGGMEKLQEINWKHDLKLVIIITDGPPNDGGHVKTLLEDPKYSKFTWLPIILSSYGSGYYFEKGMRELFPNLEVIENINDLHKAIYKLVKREVLKNGSKMSA